MHIPDLTTKPLMFPGAAPVPVRSVGWLSDKQPFTTGKVDRAVIRRLQEFQAASRSGWQPYLSLGRHTCELCEDATSWTHLFIPADGFMYCAPEGIVHYIVSHRYAPPLEFCEAVLKSPPPDSNEYFQALAALGCGTQFLQDGTNRSEVERRRPSFLSRLMRRRLPRHKAIDRLFAVALTLVLVRIIIGLLIDAAR